MVQILRGPTPEQITSQQIGSPILNSLQSLADMQLKNIEKQKQRAGTLAGLSSFLPKEQANFLSFLPPELLRTVLPRIQQQQQTQQLIDNRRRQRAAEGQARKTKSEREAARIKDIKAAPVTEANPAIEEEVDTGVVDTRRQDNKRRLLKDQRKSDKAFDDTLASTGDQRLAFQAEESEKNRLQKKRIADQKRRDKIDLIEAGTVSKALEGASVKADAAQERLEGYQASADNYDNVLRVLKAGKPLTGLSFSLLKHFGIEKGATNTETQIIQKMLSAEPVRALKTLPPQAARLSKVFDTLKDMHGSLANTNEGLQLISRLKKVEAQAAALIDEKYIDKLEEFRKNKKAPPFNLRKQIVKSAAKELNKFGSEMQYILSDNVEKQGAKLKDFKFGEFTVEVDDQNKPTGMRFVKRKVFGRPAWVDASREASKKG